MIECRVDFWKRGAKKKYKENGEEGEEEGGRGKGERKEWYSGIVGDESANSRKNGERAHMRVGDDGYISCSARRSKDGR